MQKILAFARGEVVKGDHLEEIKQTELKLRLLKENSDTSSSDYEKVDRQEN